MVRSSYGINYNTGQYARFASEPGEPAAVLPDPDEYAEHRREQHRLHAGKHDARITASTARLQITQSTFGVNPNYRLGMVQAYNLGVQRTLGKGIVLNIDYTGAHASNLDIIRAPNRTPTSVLNPSITQFNYEDSLGYQRSNAPHRQYPQSHAEGHRAWSDVQVLALDRQRIFGRRSGNFIAQNDQDLNAEESNSSFDQRHPLQGNFVIEPPFGPNRAFFNKGGVVSKILDGYSISGNYTFATGGWATPSYSLTPQEIASGAPSSLRPDRNFCAADQRSGKSSAVVQHARHLPITRMQTHYGNASRNSIELPGDGRGEWLTLANVALGETRSIEFRLNASNAFNTVQYSGVDTTLNSQTYGQVIGVAPMRSLNYRRGSGSREQFGMGYRYEGERQCAELWPRRSGDGPGDHRPRECRCTRWRSRIAA